MYVQLSSWNRGLVFSVNLHILHYSVGIVKALLRVCLCSVYSVPMR